MQAADNYGWDVNQRREFCELLRAAGREAWADELFYWRRNMENAIEMDHSRWIRAIDPRRVRKGDYWVAVGANLVELNPPAPHNLRRACEIDDIPSIQAEPGRYMVFRPRIARFDRKFDGSRSRIMFRIPVRIGPNGLSELHKKFADNGKAFDWTDVHTRDLPLLGPSYIVAVVVNR